MPDTLAPSPYRIAADTHVIPELFHAGPDAFIPINSMVITGREPVVVDTGTSLNSVRWLDAVGSLVDFEDVRWIFLSHDDHDHVGNLPAMLELCPRATLVTTWFTLERLAGDLRVPLERCRWVRDGESFDAGDRQLRAVRPPVFDAPTTRGLFDSSTGVYWAADSFASLVPEHVTDAADVPDEMFVDTFLHLNRLVSPWVGLTDQAKFDAVVDSVADLVPEVVASAHAPALTDQRLKEAIELVRTLPGMDAAVEPGQADLEEMVSSVLAA